MKTATTIEEQIQLLKARGMSISDENKAKEYLLDIGYYRLGFYWFPYEKEYPHSNAKHRTHQFKEGAQLENAIKLYYFDKDLRALLSEYLFRIEVHFRTQMIYWLSNKHKDNPTWYMDTKIVDKSYVDGFASKYTTYISKHSSIKHHHIVHYNDKYAPAWKTLEYFTLGEMECLYHALRSNDDKLLISTLYGIKPADTLSTYLTVVRVVRNLCAHGNNIYDLKLQKSIPGGHLKIKGDDCGNLVGAIKVIMYLLSHVSENRCRDFNQRLFDLIHKEENKSIYDIIGYLERATNIGL